MEHFPSLLRGGPFNLRPENIRSLRWEMLREELPGESMWGALSWEKLRKREAGGVADVQPQEEEGASLCHILQECRVRGDKVRVCVEWMQAWVCWAAFGRDFWCQVPRSRLPPYLLILCLSSKPIHVLWGLKLAQWKERLSLRTKLQNHKFKTFGPRASEGSWRLGTISFTISTSAYPKHGLQVFVYFLIACLHH